MSLPLTPDEPLGTDTPTLPTYNSSPVYPNHTPSPTVPLTPESIVSPQSSCNGEELDEVLSYFSGGVECDVCPPSPAAPAAPAASLTPSTIYFSGGVECDVCPPSPAPAAAASLTPSTICNDSKLESSTVMALNLIFEVFIAGL